jgi:hypothetical protein
LDNGHLINAAVGFQADDPERGYGLIADELFHAMEFSVGEKRVQHRAPWRRSPQVLRSAAGRG